MNNFFILVFNHVKQFLLKFNFSTRLYELLRGLFPLLFEFAKEIPHSCTVRNSFLLLPLLSPLES